MSMQPRHVQTSSPWHKIGRLPKYDESTHPRLKLADHIAAGYSGYVPDSVDYSVNVGTWPMYMNDQLGDCTAADAGHGEEVWSQYGQGQATLVTDNDIVTFYAGSTGYVPGDPSTDQGGNLQDVCNYYLKTGLAGHKIIAFFEVNPADNTELRTALYLFGGVSIGMDFPAYAMDQFNAGQPWDIQHHNAQIEGGHDVLLVGASTNGNYKVVSWGKVQEVTPAFWAKYMAGEDGEAWARVSQEWVNATGAIPAGLNVNSANAAFQSLTNQPGPFTTTPPTPTPSPSPDPTPSPTPPTPDPAPANSTPDATDAALITAFNTWYQARGYSQ